LSRTLAVFTVSALAISFTIPTVAAKATVAVLTHQAIPIVTTVAFAVLTVATFAVGLQAAGCPERHKLKEHSRIII